MPLTKTPRSGAVAVASPILFAAIGVMLGSPSRGSAGEPTLTISPNRVELGGPGDRQQLAVTFRDANGELRDVTHQATFAIEPDGPAKVTKQGVVTPVRDGVTTLITHWNDTNAAVEVIVDRTGTARPSSYRLEVSALLSKAGCNMGACHGNLNGKGGFKLSLRGDDPALDLRNLARDAQGRRLNVAVPEDSLALLKATGRVPHEGGTRFGTDSFEADLLRSWIANGAVDDRDRAPEVVELDVFPKVRTVAAPGLDQQLVVTARFDDGTTRDVTHLAAFDVDDPTAVRVVGDGHVRREGPGESVVAARYLGHQAVSRLAFLPDRPDFAWDGPEAANPIDAAVFDKLRALKINASATAPDHVFLRRAYLDAIGVLPTPEEARAFLQSDEPDKRAELIDALLDRPEFADLWALKWADLLRNEEKTMGSKGVWAFRRWLRDQVQDDVPLTDFAEDLLVGGGSTWNNPPASFYRTNLDPETCAETFGQVFLGVRLQCARCHNHPFDVWTQDDYYGLAAAFANVERKQVNNERRDTFDKHEVNGDVVVFLQGRPGRRNPSSGERLPPTAPSGPVLVPEADNDARIPLAHWLTTESRQFSRNLANRVWYHLNGRGVVEPVDDFRASNPPSNPELLDALTVAFVDGGHRLKPLVRLIMNSKVYALDSTPRPTNLDDEANFARSRVKLLPAEVLLDAIACALDRPVGLDDAPGGTRAVSLAGVSTGPSFLDAFGKPDRLLTCECERSETTTLAQAFQLINGQAVRDLLEAPDNRIGQLLDASADDAAILDELYLAALCRHPSEEEHAGTLGYLDHAPNRRRAWEDVAWALINSKEFLLRH